MAHHKSAKKRIRRNARREIINSDRRSRVRTFIRKVESALASGDKSAAADALKAAQPELHRSVSKGVLHRNTVARKISRLNARIRAL